MIPIELKQNLPFTSITVGYQGNAIDIPHVLIDTGSGRTIFAADIVAQIGIVPLENDMIYTIRGVGGTEAVFVRCVDYLKIGKHRLTNFEIEIGGMDYGFEINGIVGMDFLLDAKAVIHLKKMIIEFNL
ncbi:retropepsin-like aspartic protease [Desulfobacterales bacterium HSG16]|nr:retropepsin-like aspartic protease [Desulfobacterales bacterium HSG16]